MLGKFSRRRFVQLAGLSGMTIAAPRALAQERQATPALAPDAAGAFPSEFIWGTATSAYQIEGPRPSSLTAPSIW